MNIISRDENARIPMISGLWNDPFFRRFFDFRFGDDEVARQTIPVDIKRTDEALVVTAALPGVAAEDIEVTIEDGLLAIKATAKAAAEDSNDKFVRRELGVGEFVRTINLPRNLDAQKTTSSYKDGALTIAIPLAESDKPLRVKVG